MVQSRSYRPVLGVLLFGGLLLAAGLSCISPAYAAEKPGTTLENLMAAFNGESNAHARYLAFARKADEEGYAPVASLFRAAAKAEEIHAATHGEVIKKMGGVPKADIAAPDVKSTRENLSAAIQGESYERDVMYPEFLKVARQDKNKDALRSFGYAKTAEAEHARIYTEALNNLGAWKGTQKKDFHVCTVCGYTVTEITFDRCPSCYNPVDKYIVVN